MRPSCSAALKRDALLQNDALTETRFDGVISVTMLAVFVFAVIIIITVVTIVVVATAVVTTTAAVIATGRGDHGWTPAGGKSPAGRV